ncbi:MAG: hypothetical protein LBE13_23385 [Bacteroidales bacterium]|jgi:DNA-binding transcriptional regulator LsrR (DeoR family)|nr:hypothetical protein [Bacteroidales bacterium]
MKNKHLISIPLEKLRNANLSVGISAYPEKAESVFAAIKAKYINSLFKVGA